MRQLIFRKNYYEAISMLPEKAQLEAYTAIMKYAFSTDTIAPSGECAPLLSMIFSSLDKDFERFEKVCAARNASARKEAAD